MENGGKSVSPEGEAGQEDEELPEDEEAMKEIVDKIAEKLEIESRNNITD
jgi:hypothetical protein